MEEYSVIGKRIPRVDGLAKVTGDAKYAADYEMPGMLWCKIAPKPPCTRKNTQYRHIPGRTASRR